MLFNILCFLVLRHISKFESELTTKVKYIMGMFPVVLVIVAEYIIYNFIDEQYLFLTVYIRAIEAFSFVIIIAAISKTYTTQFEKNSFFQGVVILGVLIGSFGMGEIGANRQITEPRQFIITENGGLHGVGSFEGARLYLSNDP